MSAPSTLVTSAAATSAAATATSAPSASAAVPADMVVPLGDDAGDCEPLLDDSQPKIIVRTATSRGKRSAAPASAVRDAAGTGTCDCSPICRRLGIGRFPPTGYWFVKDVCGVFCAMFTWFLMFYAEYVVLFIVLIPAPSLAFKCINGVIFHILIFLAFSSHCKAMLSDPGAVPLGNATKENILRMGYRDGKDRVIYKCPKCCCIKPERSHHCSVCRRCIRKMDHHCPWVNNCVGETNQKYFVLFTLYICISSFFAIYLTVHYFVLCIGSEWESCQSGFSPPATTIFLVFLLVEGVLFGLFTAIMCGEQVHGIVNDQTGIESLKREKHNWEKKSKLVSMEAVFGHPFSWRWLSPFSTPNLSNGKNQPYMYSV